MTIFIIGINHKTAPIAVREKIYFASDQLTLYLQDLLNSGCAHEAVILSTCNRSELYCVTENIHLVRQWFFAQTTLSHELLESMIYSYEDQQAISHMMEVACGLDSMVLGEPQILGQMKSAYSESCSVDAVSTIFHRLFQMIFAVAKEVRTHTRIGACPVSLASAAVHFVKHSHDVTQKNIMIIGAGAMAELLLRYLDTIKMQSCVVMNRHIERAKKLKNIAKNNMITACDLTQLTQQLLTADIVFSVTGSTTPIIDKHKMSLIMMQRMNKPLYFIDIALPRDIATNVSELENIHLFCIDDLKMIIDTNKHGREHAAEQARILIQQKSSALSEELKSLPTINHTIAVYRKQIEKLCRSELAKAKQALHAGEDPLEVLNYFADAFTKKLLHVPSTQLRQAGVEGHFELLAFAKKLFAIPDHEAERL